MAMKYQKGTVYVTGKRIKMWYGQYLVYRNDQDGKEVRKQRNVRICPKAITPKFAIPPPTPGVVSPENVESVIVMPSELFRMPPPATVAGAPAALRAVLASALGTGIVVSKTRLLYLVGQTRVHLDEVAGPEILHRHDMAQGFTAHGLGPQPDQVGMVEFVVLGGRQLRAGDMKTKVGQALRRPPVVHPGQPHDKHVVPQQARARDREMAAAIFRRQRAVTKDSHWIARKAFQAELASHAMRRADDSDENPVVLPHRANSPSRRGRCVPVRTRLPDPSTRPRVQEPVAALTP